MHAYMVYTYMVYTPRMHAKNPPISRLFTLTAIFHFLAVAPPPHILTAIFHFLAVAPPPHITWLRRGMHAYMVYTYMVDTRH